VCTESECARIRISIVFRQVSRKLLLTRPPTLHEPLSPPDLVETTVASRAFARGDLRFTPGRPMGGIRQQSLWLTRSCESSKGGTERRGSMQIAESGVGCARQVRIRAKSLDPFSCSIACFVFGPSNDAGSPNHGKFPSGCLYGRHETSSSSSPSVADVE